MADSTVRLNEEGEVMRMVNAEGDPKIRKIMEARDTKGNPERESDPDFDYYANLTEEEIAKEFQKLSPADKIWYNEWFDFHTKYQQSTAIGGTISQIIHGISNQNKLLIPDEILKKEFEEVEFDPDQVQVERMVDRDGKEIKWVKPIHIVMIWIKFQGTKFFLIISMNQMHNLLLWLWNQYLELINSKRPCF